MKLDLLLFQLLVGVLDEKLIMKALLILTTMVRTLA